MTPQDDTHRVACTASRAVLSPAQAHTFQSLAVTSLQTRGPLHVVRGPAAAVAHDTARRGRHVVIYDVLLPRGQYGARIVTQGHLILILPLQDVVLVHIGREDKQNDTGEDFDGARRAEYDVVEVV